MPSDANGVYSLPAGYLAITGNVIQASQHNPPLEDLAAAMTGRLATSGSNAMTGPLKGNATGTVGAPSYAFAGAQTTGWYPTAGGIGITVNGTKVAEFTAGGLVSGARFLGELIPYSGSSAPALTVFPVGQTLSRATYAALWAFAQTEIAAGNTLYNNGDGTTTFGVADLRGRVPFGQDDMGGSAASRLTTAGGGIDGATLGAVSTNGQSKTLVTANLPPYTPAGSVSTTTTALAYLGPGSNGASPGSTQVGVPTISSTFTGTPQGGTSTAFPIVPPGIVTNYLLFAGA